MARENKAQMGRKGVVQLDVYVETKVFWGARENWRWSLYSQWSPTRYTCFPSCPLLGCVTGPILVSFVGRPPITIPLLLFPPLHHIFLLAIWELMLLDLIMQRVLIQGDPCWRYSSRSLGDVRGRCYWREFYVPVFFCWPSFSGRGRNRRHGFGVIVCQRNMLPEWILPSPLFLGFFWGVQAR